MSLVPMEIYFKAFFYYGTYICDGSKMCICMFLYYRAMLRIGTA